MPMKYFVYSLFILLIFSCTETEIPYDSPEIEIFVVDDILPTSVYFKVDDIWEGYDWRFNKKYGSGNDHDFENTYLFGSPDSALVELTVYKEKYTIKVDSVFSLPTKEWSDMEVFGLTFTGVKRELINEKENLKLVYLFNNQTDTVSVNKNIDSNFIDLEKPISLPIRDYFLDDSKDSNVSFRLYANGNQMIYNVQFSIHQITPGILDDRDIFDGGFKELTVDYENNGLVYLNVDVK
jgi:hypothetical protein